MTDEEGATDLAGSGGEGGPFKDYARVPASAEGQRHSKLRSASTHFPTLLHMVITRAEQNGYSHICAWHAHGRSFSVYKRDLFVSEVMPNYFRQSQYASFQRQLNLYGFRRISQKSPDHGSYYHEMFLRSRADLCQDILRAKEKDMRAHKAAQGEPDFGKMEPMPESSDDGGEQEKFAGEGRQQSVSQMGSLHKQTQPGGDPLKNLFKTIAMKEFDTSDCWMEPRPIAPVRSRSATLPSNTGYDVPTSVSSISGYQSGPAGWVSPVMNLSFFPPNQSSGNGQGLEFYRRVSEVSESDHVWRG